MEGLKRRTPSHVFEQWKAFHKMQRWGEDWQQAAQLTAAELKTNKPISDFMPKYTPPADDDDPQAMIDRSNRILSAFLKVHNAKFNRG